jgi:hypothetical protein
MSIEAYRERGHLSGVRVPLTSGSVAYQMEAPRTTPAPTTTAILPKTRSDLQHSRA